MRASNGSSKETPEPPKNNNSTVILLLGSMADTTWRMFVPTLAGITGGYALDNTLSTTPWLFAIGTILGCIVAGLLIRKQLRNT